MAKKKLKDWLQENFLGLIGLVSPIVSWPISMAIQLAIEKNEDTAEFLAGFIPLLTFVVSLIVAGAWISFRRPKKDSPWRFASFCLPIIFLIILIVNLDHVHRVLGAWCNRQWMPTSLELSADPDQITFGSGKQAKLTLRVNNHAPRSAYSIIINEPIDSSTNEPFYRGPASTITRFNPDSWLTGYNAPGSTVRVPLIATVSDQNGNLIGETEPAIIVVQFPDKVQIVPKDSYAQAEKRMYYNETVSLEATVNDAPPPAGCRVDWLREPEIGTVMSHAATLEFKAPENGKDEQKVELTLTVKDKIGNELGNSSMTLVLVLPKANYTFFVIDSSARMKFKTSDKAALDYAKEDISHAFEKIRDFGGFVGIGAFGANINPPADRCQNVTELFGLQPFDESVCRQRLSALEPGFDEAPLLKGVHDGLHALGLSKADSGRIHLVVVTGGPDTCQKTSLREYHRAIRSAIDEKQTFGTAWRSHHLLTLTIEVAFDSRGHGATSMSKDERRDLVGEYGEFPHLFIRVRDPETLSSLLESVSDLASNDFKTQENAFDRMITVFRNAEDEMGVLNLQRYKSNVRTPQ
jgi:hypothetical protein